MPELPDVQVFKEYFDATSLHQNIAGITVRAPELLEGISARKLRDRFAGRAFTATRRHGKHLFAGLEGEGWLALHFGMTGLLSYFRKPDKEPDHVRLGIDFENGYRLAYACPRKLGQIAWTEDPETFVREWELGPDALSLTGDRRRLQEVLGKRRGGIKSALMDQEVLAGIGNVYSDEILFQAAVHPRREVGDLDDGMWNRLSRSLGHVLRTAIERRVGEKGWPDSWLLPRREEGVSCPRCDGAIERRKISGRGSYLCPGHQR